MLPNEWGCDTPPLVPRIPQYIQSFASTRRHAVAFSAPRENQRQTCSSGCAMLKDFPAMVADPLVSSEAFIKAIKGVSDPPVEGGLNKVELSLEALARSSLYVPAKAEVITEWAISKMFKEKMFQMCVRPTYSYCDTSLI